MTTTAPGVCTSAGDGSPDVHDAQRRNRLEEAGDDIRQTYVALTRAQSQVVAWWAPSWDEPNGGLSRLLRGALGGRCRGAGALRQRHHG